ncbi:triacylglycerol lipase [Oceanicoccus sp. KOV_DT_Chl]|uniref:esterase/lipase family protein n=1 Tax=Oceanicoccus sp. KOV_DT_Chl TaxID=1904639 RepID=UPI000C7BBA60|nr:alpha/beta hydrolase [Oceanicoccus sp. KOV_DT_Chl]
MTNQPSFIPTNHSQSALSPQRLLLIWLTAAVLIFTSGCSLYDTKVQLDSIQKTLSQLTGEIVNKSGVSGPVYAVLLEELDLQIGWREEVLTDQEGRYALSTLTGKFYVGAFIDANSDGKYQQDEPAAIVQDDNGLPLRYDITEQSQHSVPTLVVSSRLNKAYGRDVVDITGAPYANIGKPISLNDPVFAEANLSMGMWKPLDFLEQVGGGLFFLEPYSKTKTPIIFVHGINGAPTNFTDIVAGLDRNKFQPWVLYYPSGLRLDIVSDYLINAVARLEADYHFKEFHVVAHSMGGLVTRSFVKKYASKKRPAQLSLVVTINSPLHGMESAAMGVKTSPIIVPSWIDVAADSAFVKDLHVWKWPANIPYQLIFSYGGGDGSDGVVPLDSQLSYSLQREAQRIYGFNDGHVTALSNKDLIETLNSILQKNN